MSTEVKDSTWPLLSRLLEGDKELTVEQAAIVASISYHWNKGHTLTTGERDSVARIYQEVYHD